MDGSHVTSGEAESAGIYSLPRRPPPFVPLAAGCCWLFVPVRQGLMNFVCP